MSADIFQVAISRRNGLTKAKNEPEVVAARRQSLMRAMDLTGISSAFTVPAVICTLIALGVDLRDDLSLLVLSAGVTLTIASTIIVQRFRKHIEELGDLGPDASSQLDHDDSETQSRWLSTWETVHAVIMAGTGCFWALPTWFNNPGNQLIHPIVFSIAAGAVCLGVCAPAKRSYLAFMMCLISMSVAAMSVMGGSHLRLIPAVVMFGFIMVLMSAMIADTFTEAFVLKAEQEDINHQLKQSNRKLTHEAFHDRLTSLPNRARLMQLADRHLARTKLDETQVAVLFVDLDRFKIVNDSLGHEVGDAVLIEVARRLEAAMRPGDVIGRLGGDEFIGILPKIPSAKVALEAAHRIKNSLDAPILVKNHELHIGACIGLTLGAWEDTTAELVRQADVAMYRAKVAGRGRIELFDENLRRVVEERTAQEHALRRAVAHDEIVAWYQPSIEVSTGRVVGVEMLARWIDPVRGVIPAAAFIDIADEAGLIDRISANLSERAMRDCTHWVRSGAVVPNFNMAINVTNSQVTKPGGLGGIIGALSDGGFDPRLFSFEVRELNARDDLKTAAAQLTALRKLGSRITLDNFGTGAGSLSLLRELPLDTVKIDGSLLRKAEKNPAITASIKSAVFAASELGLSSMAVGIETDAQLELVRNLGVTVAQGLLWSDAIPATRVADFVDAREYVAQTLHGLL